MNMNKLNIFSIEFGNGKMFFVGKNESIKYIKNHFNWKDTHNDVVNINVMTDLAIKNNVFVNIMPNNIKDKLYAKLFIISKLKKHKLWMSFDQYLAAMCFTENGKKEIKMLLNMSDDDIDLICKNSEWNKILK
mgnify:FL=1|jgi:hypothetical protein